MSYIMMLICDIFFDDYTYYNVFMSGYTYYINMYVYHRLIQQSNEKDIKRAASWNVRRLETNTKLLYDIPMNYVTSHNAK